MVAGETSLVRCVTGAGNTGDVQIGNRDNMEVFAIEIRQYLLKMREAILVHGERTMSLLKINVQIEHVGGNLVGPQARGNFAHTRFGFVTEAGLLKAQRPQRRKRRQTRQPSVRLHYLFRVRPIEEVIVDRAAFGSKRISVSLAFAEVKTGGPGIVEQKSHGVAGADGHKKWDALINR